MPGSRARPSKRRAIAKRLAQVDIFSVSGEPIAAFELRQSTPIKQLKQAIERKTGVVSFRQRLVHALESSELADRTVLSDLKPPLVLTLVIIAYQRDAEMAQQLLSAAKCGDKNVADALLRKAAYPDCTDRYACKPLHIAAEKGCTDVVRLLCEAGADKKAAKPDHMTPLFCAAQNGHFEVMRVLYNAGVDKHQVLPNGATPLHHAASYGHLEAVGFLCMARADVNTEAQNGATPLHDASYNGHASVVQFLCDMGANRRKVTSIGATPGIAAARNGHLAVIEVLCAREADAYERELTRCLRQLIASQSELTGPLLPGYLLTTLPGFSQSENNSQFDEAWRVVKDYLDVGVPFHSIPLLRIE